MPLENISSAFLANISMLKLYVDMIPPVDGSSSTLNQFASNCNSLMKAYENNRDILFKNYVVMVVQSKLIGHANLLKGNRSELDIWPLIKDALENYFIDKRSLECLEQDLLMAHPNKGESPFDFGNLT